MIIILSALLVSIWVLPIFSGIRAAKRKNRSAHWLWFGVHPVGALIAWLAIELSTALKTCPNCGRKTSASSKYCPGCSEPFAVSLSVPSDHHGWAQRHKGWAIAFTVVFSLASFGAMMFGLVNLSFRNSWVYQDALKQAQSDVEVIELLGAPIKDGWLASGSLKLEGDGEGTADLSFPIHGPEMKGNLSVLAERHNGKWSYRTLELNTSDGQRGINLLRRK